jgi:hypothetical protein
MGEPAREKCVSCFNEESQLRGKKKQKAVLSYTALSVWF